MAEDVGVSRDEEERDEPAQGPLPLARPEVGREREEDGEEEQGEPRREDDRLRPRRGSARRLRGTSPQNRRGLRYQRCQFTYH